MTEAPDYIWLQHDPNDENPADEMPDDWTVDGITWCWERIGQSDVTYIRADLYNVLLTEKNADVECIGSLLAENERLREALRFYSDEGHDGYDVEITDYGISMSTGHIIKDGGDIARAALATSEDAQ